MKHFSWIFAALVLTGCGMYAQPKEPWQEPDFNAMLGEWETKSPTLRWFFRFDNEGRFLFQERTVDTNAGSSEVKGTYFFENHRLRITVESATGEPAARGEAAKAYIESLDKSGMVAAPQGRLQINLTNGTYLTLDHLK